MPAPIAAPSLPPISPPIAAPSAVPTTALPTAALFAFCCGVVPPSACVANWRHPASSTWNWSKVCRLPGSADCVGPSGSVVQPARPSTPTSAVISGQRSARRSLLALRDLRFDPPPPFGAGAHIRVIALCALAPVPPLLRLGDWRNRRVAFDEDARLGRNHHDLRRRDDCNARTPDGRTPDAGSPPSGPQTPGPQAPGPHQPGPTQTLPRQLLPCHARTPSPTPTSPVPRPRPKRSTRGDRRRPGHGPTPTR